MELILIKFIDNSQSFYKNGSYKAPQDRQKRIDIVQLKRAFMCWGIPILYGRKQANKDTLL